MSWTSWRTPEPIIGPRQTTGVPCGSTNPIEAARTPWASIVCIPCWPSASPPCSMPSMVGMFGPVMSASTRPASAPSRASATARLTATVDLPTPPLLEATAIRFLTPATGSGPSLAARLRAHLGVPLDLDRVDAGDGVEGGAHVEVDPLAEGAGRGGQHQPEPGRRPVHAHIADHAEGHQVAVQFGVADPGEGRQYGLGARHVTSLRLRPRVRRASGRSTRRWEPSGRCERCIRRMASARRARRRRREEAGAGPGQV